MMMKNEDQASRKDRLKREATRVLGSQDKANRWLRTWSPFLGGIPEEMAAAPESYALVMDELVRIEFGDLT